MAEKARKRVALDAVVTTIESSSAPGALVDLPAELPVKTANRIVTESSLSQSPTLITLPPELHLKLFKSFDISTSVCLGLTCKNFYSIHYSIHGKVLLKTKSMTYYTLPFPVVKIMPFIPYNAVSSDLPELISGCMGPRYFYQEFWQAFQPIEEETEYEHFLECRMPKNGLVGSYLGRCGRCLVYGARQHQRHYRFVVRRDRDLRTAQNQTTVQEVFETRD